MNNDVRSLYLGSAVETASPAQLLLMLVDRLVLDLRRGLAAQESGDRPTSHTNLVHAQQIVEELFTSLQTGTWSGATRLSSLYDYIYRRLVTANVRDDASITRECLELVEPLADAWHRASVAMGVPSEGIGA
jgi:flagellar protein FliS